MFALTNKVQLIGNVAKDPELKIIGNNKKIARMTIATTESYRNAKGDKISETQWHNLVAWGKIAEIIERICKKGSRVAIEGKLVNRTYTNKSGEKKYMTEIVLTEMLSLSQKPSTS